MIKQFRDLLRLKEEAKHCAQEAELVLSNYVKQNYLDLLEEYVSWFDQKRNINAAAITKIINAAVCDLEGRVFDENKKYLSFFAGATARMSDDLLDNGIVQPEEAYLLHNTPVKKGKTLSLRLFYALDSGLADLLPQDFSQDFENVIQQFNQAQADSLRLLKGELTSQELIDIKNRTGGYSALLLYSFLFPEFGDLSRDSVGNYNSSGNPPRTKTEALYNFGAWLSRVDDLWDKPYDKKKGMRQLATEGIITWRGLKPETEYTFRGLSLFYPHERVQVFRGRFKPLTSKVLAKLFY